MRRTVSLIVIVAAGASAAVAGAATGTSPPPSATTGKPLFLRADTAIVSGTVNPRGSDTTVHFEFGAGDGYGYYRTSKFVDVGSGGAPVPIRVRTDGFIANQTYHYRIVASSSAGTMHGSDRSFTTPPPTVLSKFSISPEPFKPGPNGDSLSKGPNGATLRFKLSIGAPVRFFVTRDAPGRRVGRRCEPLDQQNQVNAHCTWHDLLSGSFLYVNRKQGRNKLHFSGRFGNKALAPGHYQLWGRPYGADKIPPAARANFTIASP